MCELSFNANMKLCKSECRSHGEMTGDEMCCIYCPCCCADCHHVWCIQFTLQFGEISAYEIYVWKVRHSCHNSRVPVCTFPQRVCCFLPGSEDRISLVIIFNLCLF